MSLNVIDPLKAGVPELRDAVAGRSQLPRGAAMGALAESGYPNKHRDFQAVLENPDEPRLYRRIAAVQLARIGTPAAEEILRHNADIQDPAVLAEVAAGLGRIGGAEALDAVLRAKDRLPGELAREAEFAAELIAHRLGLEQGYAAGCDDVEFVEPPSGCANPMRFRPARRGEIEQALIHLARDPFGIELADTPMFKIECEEETWMLLLNREYAGASAVERLSGRRALAAVAATKLNAEEDCHSALVVLTSPAKRGSGLEIRLFEPGGQLEYAGTGEIEGKSLRFSIRAVKRPGAAPVRISGRFGEGGLEIEQGVSASRVIPKRHPRPLPPPAE